MNIQRLLTLGLLVGLATSPGAAASGGALTVARYPPAPAVGGLRSAVALSAGVSAIRWAAVQKDLRLPERPTAWQERLGPSGLLSTFPIPDWTAEGDQTSAQFGYSVSSAGDVNGDGFADVLVGAIFYDNGQIDEGRAYLYYGSASGLSTAPDWTAEGDQAYAHLGPVGAAGDVNGDGFDDVIVGAAEYDHGQTDEGRAFVYYGSASGLSPTPNWTAESDQAYASFGILASTAGDVNADGYADVVIAARFYDNGQIDEGRVYVYHGSASGLSATPNWTAEGNQISANFGELVSTAGDVNGDGYADLILGAYLYDNGQTDEGQAYLYYGSATGLSATPDWMAEGNQAGAYFGYVGSAGDVNADGYADVVIGAWGYDNGQADEGRAFLYHGSASGLSAAPDWTAESNQVSANFGNSVGTTTGDVNGDGYSDVLVGSRFYDHGQADEGRAFLFLGSAAGLSTAADWTAESDQDSAYLGNRVTTAGDVNGDGYADALVAASWYDNGQVDEGQALVFHGSATGLRQTMHVASIDPRYRQSGNVYRVGASVTIQDDTGAPVLEARVRVTVTLPGGDVIGLKDATDDSGTAVVTLVSPDSGTYVFKVVEVLKGTWIYDPSQNVETSDSITIP